MTDVGLGVRGGVNPLYEPTKIDSTKSKDATGGLQNLKAPQDYKASHGVLSGTELMEKMGAPPSKDVKIFGHTIKTNSTAYKNTLDHLQTYQQQVDSLKDQRLEKVPKGTIDSMKQQLQDVMDGADAYMAKHANSASKGARSGVMAELKNMAKEEMDRLDQLTQGKLTNVKDKDINISEGLALLRGGVTDASGFTRDLNDSMVTKSKTLGSGKVNTVEQVEYGGEKRAVKPLDKGTDQLMAGEKATGFDQDNMLTGARNLATGKVANLLGIGNSVPTPDIVIRNGQAALAMKPAPGESLIKKVDVEVTDPKDIAKYDNELARGWHDNLKSYAVHKNPDDGKWYKTEAHFKEIPYTSTTNPKLAASVQTGLLDLQGLHCLLGQVDGQPENIFVQVKGDTAVVTGIDQDMCLGRDFNTLEIGDDRLKATYAGPPPLMSRDFYDALKGMTDDQLKYALGPDMPADEKANACVRLKLLQDHADVLQGQGRVIDNDKFDSWRDPTTGQRVGAFCKSSKLRSYIQRDMTTLEKTTKKVALDMTKHV